MRFLRFLCLRFANYAKTIRKGNFLTNFEIGSKTSQNLGPGWNCFPKTPPTKNVIQLSLSSRKMKVKVEFLQRQQEQTTIWYSQSENSKIKGRFKINVLILKQAPLGGTFVYVEV